MNYYEIAAEKDAFMQLQMCSKVFVYASPNISLSKRLAVTVI